MYKIILHEINKTQNALLSFEKGGLFGFVLGSSLRALL